MRLPNDTRSSWLSRGERPSRVFGTGSEEYDLYEQDGEFVLSIELPGYDVEDIDVAWHEGRLTVAADRVEESRDRTRTYRRSFRMPDRIDDEEIRARYKNGILDVYLPTVDGPTTKGTSIPIES